MLNIFVMRNPTVTRVSVTEMSVSVAFGCHRFSKITELIERFGGLDYSAELRSLN